MCKLKWEKFSYGFGGNCKKVNSIVMEVCEVEWECTNEEYEMNKRCFRCKNL